MEAYNTLKDRLGVSFREAGQQSTHTMRARAGMDYGWSTKQQDSEGGRFSSHTAYSHKNAKYRYWNGWSLKAGNLNTVVQEHQHYHVLDLMKFWIREMGSHHYREHVWEWHNCSTVISVYMCMHIRTKIYIYIWIFILDMWAPHIHAKYRTAH